MLTTEAADILFPTLSNIRKLTPSRSPSVPVEAQVYATSPDSNTLIFGPPTTVRAASRFEFANWDWNASSSLTLNKPYAYCFLASALLTAKIRPANGPWATQAPYRQDIAVSCHIRRVGVQPCHGFGRAISLDPLVLHHIHLGARSCSVAVTNC